MLDCPASGNCIRLRLHSMPSMHAEPPVLTSNYLSGTHLRCPCRLALGRDWSPPPGTSSQISSDLAFSRLLSAVTSTKNTQPLDTKLRVALTMVGAGDVAHSFVKSVAGKVTSNLRVQGRTAYVAWDDGEPVVIWARRVHAIK